MAPVDWDHLTDEVYESMVSVLLSCMNTGAQRIDGAGGDEGRDVQLVGDNRKDFFQLKYFPDRIDPRRGRRAQVERSLARAAKQAPDSWTLVVPVDGSPDELRWFEGLRTKYRFPLSWFGRNDLNREMARHPYVQRYFLESAAEEAIRVIREIAAEQRQLAGGVGEAMERLQRLGARLNEIDAYYRFDLKLTGGQTEVAVIPRFKGAEVERPIIVRIAGRFPLTTEGEAARQAYQRAIDFGYPVDLDARFIEGVTVTGLPGAQGEMSVQSVSMNPIEEPSWSSRAEFVVVSPEERELASIPILFTRRHRGKHGGVVYGRDLSGALSIEMTVDDIRQACTTHFAYDPPAAGEFPGSMLPLLRFLSVLHPPNLALMRITSHGPIAPPAPIPDLPQLPAEFVDLVEKLEVVQARTNRHFELPEGFTPKDVAEIREAYSLLNGETIPYRSEPISMTAGRLLDKAKLRAAAESDEPANYRIVGAEASVTIAGHQISLGPAITELRAAVVSNREELLVALERGEDRELRVTLIATAGTFLRLGPTAGDASGQVGSLG